jgi:Putative MetA-pathway of phenol degradation
MGTGRLLVAAAAFAMAAPALAEEPLRKFCPDRPGLGTPACTIDPGHFEVELGLADWTLDRQPDMRTDTILAGDLLVRIGLAEHTELQLGWTAFGHERVRDRIGGGVERRSGTGDLFVAVRRNLLHADGSGTTVAIMPYATLPTGGGAIGAGTWTAGVELPFGFDLSDKIALEFAPRVEAAADEDGSGRHLLFGTVGGIDVDFSESLNAAAEISAMRDDDPAGHETELLAGLSLGWMARHNLQLDAGANLGLNHDSPDFELYAGVTRRF